MPHIVLVSGSTKLHSWRSRKNKTLTLNFFRVEELRKAVGAEKGEGNSAIADSDEESDIEGEFQELWLLQASVVILLCCCLFQLVFV